jgi:hypothetical protein
MGTHIFFFKEEGGPLELDRPQEVLLFAMVPSALLSSNQQSLINILG